MKKRKSNVKPRICPHCGLEFGGTVLHAHIPRCLDNPEYVTLLERIPVGISRRDYDKSAAHQGWPAATTIQQQFGAWPKFHYWQRTGRRWREPGAAPTPATEAEAEVGAELEAMRAAARYGTGLKVFDTPRSSWTAGGRTWVSWGIR